VQPTSGLPTPDTVGISAAAGRYLRLTPARSPQRVVLHVVRDGLDPGRTPAPTAAHLVKHVPDPRVLRHAHAHLRKVTRERITVHEARAPATPNLHTRRRS